MNSFKSMIFLFFVHIVVAQQTIEVEYHQYKTFDAEKVKNQKVKINDVELNAIQLVNYYEEEMKKYIPFLLITTNEASTFNEKPMLNGGSSSSIFDDAGNGNYYKDLKNKFYMHESVGFGYDQIIKDSIPKIEWFISRENKKILGYKATKATATINQKDIVAWFVKDLPFSSGPVSYIGLPGLILEMEIHANNKINLVERYDAVSVKKLKNSKAIKKPEKGITVDLETYKMNMKAFWKRMEEMDGNGVETKF